MKKGYSELVVNERDNFLFFVLFSYDILFSLLILTILLQWNEGIDSINKTEYDIFNTQIC